MRLGLPAVLLSLVLVHLGWREPGEPFFYGDETRHVMTGVFVADMFRDGDVSRSYAERYYAQYPALGLLVWPPGFYLAEGLLFTLTGPSYPAARNLVVAYLLLAVAYLYALVRRTHGPGPAVMAAALFGICREVFDHTRNVMLEVPMTACVLGAVFHLERYLSGGRRRELALVGLWTAAAGLHRYDAAFLPAYFALRLLFARRLGLVLKRDVLVCAVAVVLALLPAYLPAYREIGAVHANSVGGHANEADGGPPAWLRATYYLSRVWYQLGHWAFVAGCVGLLLRFRIVVGTLRVPRRHTECADYYGPPAAPYLALLLSVYLMFAPLSEQATRHTMAWLPAWCALAADAVFRVRRPWLLAALVVGHSAFWTLKQPVPRVRGYADAAGHVVANTRGPAVVLFDGLQDGTFVYETRLADPARRVWVARADKLLYAVRSDPAAGYAEWVASDADILRVVGELSPEFVVVEDPPAKYELPVARRLRELLAGRPDLFERVFAVPVRNNNQEFLDGVSLVGYRLTARPAGERRLRFKMLWGGQDVDLEVR